MSQRCERREFILKLLQGACSTLLFQVGGAIPASGESRVAAEEAEPPLYGMGIQVNQCIGCGRCAVACKAENDVPQEPIYFRTWIERYVIHEEGEATVDSPEGGINGFSPIEEERDVLRSFFVPKLCNHCDNPPCVQVCPVGATFRSEEGVVLVDKDWCVGCRYCIQACPYGARFLDPRTKTADKCTFCYHRIRKGLLPACVEVCPTQTRVFGEIKSMTSPLRRMMRMNPLQTLKADLNTEPKVFYSELDKEVR